MLNIVYHQRKIGKKLVMKYIRLYKLITFSRAPTPLIVVEDIAYAFWLYKSRTRFGYTNCVRVVGLLKR